MTGASTLTSLKALLPLPPPGLTPRFVLTVGLIFLGMQPEFEARAQTLQERIDRARPGDTLVVYVTEKGPVVVTKRLALIGRGQPTLSGEGHGTVLTVNADSCLIRGLTIERVGKNLLTDDAAILLTSDHNVVEDNVLRDVLFGIYLLRSDSNRVVRNTIVGRPHLDLGDRGSGIHMFDSYDNYFADNTIRYTRDGFYMQNASRTTIEDNHVSEVRYGLHYMYADTNVFLRNTFLHNVAGAAIMYSREIRFRHNVFAHNRGFASFGILFQDCRGIVADSNVIADNVVGMFFEATTDNIFRHNIIAQNDVALQMFQNSTHNVFAENNFVDNLSPLLLEGKKTHSYWNQAGRGNYWSDYRGYDLDANGIGDIPMKIQNVFQYLEGQRPNIRLYLYSPASQAIAAATHAFPIINITAEIDSCPLMAPVDMGAMSAARIIAEERRSASSTWMYIIPGLGACVLGVLYQRLQRRAQYD